MIDSDTRRELAWKAVSTGTGALAALATRRGLGVVWLRVRGGDQEPPSNPADRQVDWGDAVLWAVAAGLGSGVSRLVAQRVAAAGWEEATGSPPPGIAS